MRDHAASQPQEVAHIKCAPCMLTLRDPVMVSRSYRGNRALPEAVKTDFVCRVVPRLITNLEEYPEAE